MPAAHTCNFTCSIQQTTIRYHDCSFDIFSFISSTSFLIELSLSTFILCSSLRIANFVFNCSMSRSFFSRFLTYGWEVTSSLTFFESVSTDSSSRVFGDTEAKISSRRFTPCFGGGTGG